MKLGLKEIVMALVVVIVIAAILFLATQPKPAPVAVATPTLVPTAAATPTPAPTAVPTVAGPTPTPGPTPVPTDKVDVVNGAVNPDDIVVKAGTTVTWYNSAGARMEVASDASSTEKFGGIIYGGQSYTHTFSTPGTYTYKEITRGGTGTVRVE